VRRKLFVKVLFLNIYSFDISNSYCGILILGLVFQEKQVLTDPLLYAFEANLERISSLGHVALRDDFHGHFISFVLRLLNDLSIDREVGEEGILAAHELAGALQNDVGSVVFGALTYQLGASAEVLLVEHLQDPVSGRSRNLVEVLDGVLQEVPETLLLLPYFELLKSEESLPEKLRRAAECPA